jgi:hypothetical protein
MKRHKESRTHELNMECGERIVANKDGIYDCDMCEFSSALKNNYRQHIFSKKHIAAKEEAEKRSSTIVNNEEMSSPMVLASMIEMFLGHLKHDQESRDTLVATQMATQMDLIKTLTEKILMAPSMGNLNNTDVTSNSHNADVTSSSQDVTSNSHNADVTNLSHNTITTTTNNNQKKFNLNIFLNEECKNATNLSDFIHDLEVNVDDLEHMCEVGYVQGLLKIISKKMNENGVTGRPMHCSDTKRETIYVRKDDTWQKDVDKGECKRLIRHIVSKGLKAMKDWGEEHPDHKVSDSKDYDFWDYVMREICNTDPKVIKSLIRQIAILTKIDKDDEEEI